MPRKRVRIGIANARRPGSRSATSPRRPPVTAAATRSPMSPPVPSAFTPVNLTTMAGRPLHALLLPPAAGAGRLLGALAAALDGTGPAVLPLDPRLPPARVTDLLRAFSPTVVETPEGAIRWPPAAAVRAPAGSGAGVP